MKERTEKTEKKRLAILRILQETDGPLGSAAITEQLQANGYEVSERTVRYYLFDMDSQGLTENLGRRGRRITRQGGRELETARVIDKVGFLTAKIDRMTYRMNFNLEKKSGTVIINVCVMKRALLERFLPQLTRVYERKLSMGRMLMLYGPDDKIDEVHVPDGMVGLGTVCSLTINGVLLGNGIPTHSRFGGLLELVDGKPSRFVEIINYDGTSIDPLEIFIRSGMTDYLGAIESGNGRIGIGFRELPAESRDQVIEISHELEEAGLGAFLEIGWPGQPLLDVPVGEGRFGAIVTGGLTPPAIMEEQAVRTPARALAGLARYEDLFPYWELSDRLRYLP